MIRFVEHPIFVCEHHVLVSETGIRAEEPGFATWSTPKENGIVSHVNVSPRFLTASNYLRRFLLSQVTYQKIKHGDGNESDKETASFSNAKVQLVFNSAKFFLLHCML